MATLYRILFLNKLNFSGPVSSLPFLRSITTTSCNKGVGKYTSGRELTRQKAKDLIFRLRPHERKMLMEELNLYAAANSMAEKADPLTTRQFQAVAIAHAIPFLGFGFLDNFIMIVAGDYIDATIGLTLGISTMAAAGLGNAVSDVAGIGSAWYVEKIAAKLGVEAPSLTPAQLEMTSVRWCSYLGKAFGVLVGCLIGMLPLMFLGKKERAHTDSS